MRTFVKLYVSEKKLKQFAKTGSYELMHKGVTYSIHRKPENIKAQKEILKLKARIKELQMRNGVGK